jgi:hypothetical protein
MINIQIEKKRLQKIIDVDEVLKTMILTSDKERLC